MALAWNGYFNIGGTSVQYEYRYAVMNRSEVTVHVRLELRLKPLADLNGHIDHEVLIYGGSYEGSASNLRVRIKNDDTAWQRDTWTAWFRVFDSNVSIGIDENMVYICPGVGLEPYTFSEEYGALGDGTDVGSYPRPSAASGVTVTPTAINVAQQNSIGTTVRWNAAMGASSYRVYLNNGTDMTTYKTVGSYSTASCTFNPKQMWVNGANWTSTEFRDGMSLYVGVEPYNSSGVGAGEVTWAGPIVYYEDKTYSPSTCFIVGWLGTRNELLHWGEDGVRIYVGDWAEGSYPIERFELRRQDGVTLAWNVADMSEDSIGKYIVLDFAKWGVVNQYVRFELRPYDSMGHAAYLPSGSFLKFSVKFCGGTMSLYGKPEWGGDEDSYRHADGDETWRSGLAYVYDGGAWRRAAAVYVYTGTGWATL